MGRAGTRNILLGVVLTALAASACGTTPTVTRQAEAPAATASPAAPSAPSPAAPAASPVAAPSPSPAPIGRPLPSPAAPPGGPTRGGVAPDRDALTAQAVADAAARTGVAPGTVRVVRVESREWPNSGLGCPKPGTAYAQVITPGYLIVLEAGGQTLEYHTDRARAELCVR